MKHLLLPILLLSLASAHSQKKGKPQYFANTISAEALKTKLYTVAGAEMEGRETAMPGQKKAAAYIESQFRAMGLQPGNGTSYQQTYPVYQDSLLSAFVEVNGKRFEINQDFQASVGANENASYRFSEALVVGEGADTDSLKKMNLAGRLILYLGNAPAGRGGAGPIVSILQSKGVAAILYRATDFPKTAQLLKGNLTTAMFRRSVAPQQFVVSAAIVNAIANEPPTSMITTPTGAQAGGEKQKDNTIKVYQANIWIELRKTTLQRESSNVIAVLPGTDLKDEYLFVTAHYDHLGMRDGQIYYGADDDGSGTVSVLQIAEAFARASKSGNAPRRTIVFMTVSGEEKGLWGSAYYSEHPVFPLEKTTADLNIDMIGRSDAERKNDTLNYVYVVGDDKLSSDLRSISEAANNKFTRLQLDYKFNDPKDPNRIYFRSDHYNFARKGVPIIFYYDGMLKADYHKVSDTPDKINYNLLARRAQLVFYTAWEMANRNALLVRDIPLPNQAR